MPKSTMRKRDAVKTRETIRLLAQHHFTEHGYDATRLRGIATEAGVNVALINRYFESKYKLFDEAVIQEISIDEMLGESKEEFGQNIARHMATKNLTEQSLDPTLAFVKSIGSSTVAPALNKMMESVLIPKLAKWLGGEDAEQRAALIFCELLGFDMLRRMAKLSSLDSENQDKITQRLAATLQAYVDDNW